MSLKIKRNLPLIVLFVGLITVLTILAGSYPIIAYAAVV